MLWHRPCGSTASPPRPTFELADVFTHHGDAYQRSHALTPEQGQAMRAIVRCRTVALGGHLDECDSCDFTRPSYNSCRNRHCPKCQGATQAAWVQKHVDRILHTHYFHVVSTLPAELRPLVHDNRRALFSLLFQTAPAALLELGQDRLGASLGITAMLHTWTRDQSFHPHLHMIVPGGGLAHDGQTWVPTAKNFLFPHLVLSRLFRGKFLAGLARLYNEGALKLRGGCDVLADPAVFAIFKDRLYSKEWNVYQKPPFGRAEEVFRYLGRYTHRIGLSNHSIIDIGDTTTRIKTKHGKTVDLKHHELIRRVLLHVLPKGFVKIRHYGLLATRSAAKLDKARECLKVSSPQHVPDNDNDDTHDRDQQSAPLTTDTQPSVAPRNCPACHVGALISRLIAPLIARHARPPPQEPR